MSFIKKICIVCGLFFVFLFLNWSWKLGSELQTAAELRNIRRGLGGYMHTHEGEAPATLYILLEEMGAELFRPERFVYVQGLSSSDPDEMPIVFSDFKETGFRGGALLLGGAVVFYKRMNLGEVEGIVSAPWDLVSDEFDSVEEFESFRKRLRLFKGQAPIAGTEP